MAEWKQPRVRERVARDERPHGETIAEMKARVRDRMPEHIARIEREEAARGYAPGTSEFADDRSTAG